MTVRLHRLSVAARRELLAARSGLSKSELDALSGGLDTERADKMVESCVGVFSLPLGIGTDVVVKKSRVNMEVGPAIDSAALMRGSISSGNGAYAASIAGRRRTAVTTSSGVSGRSSSAPELRTCSAFVRATCLFSCGRSAGKAMGNREQCYTIRPRKRKFIKTAWFV